MFLLFHLSNVLAVRLYYGISNLFDDVIHNWSMCMHNDSLFANILRYN